MRPLSRDESLVVVSSPFLSQKMTRGNDNSWLQIVKSVNGVRLKNLDHLGQILRVSAIDRFLTFEFEGKATETIASRAKMCRRQRKGSSVTTACALTARRKC